MFKNGWKKKFTEYLKRKKRFVIGIVIVLAIFTFVNVSAKKSNGSTSGAKTQTVNIDRNFEFPAINNLAKKVPDKIKVRIKGVEKTNQVLVKDQVFTAKNNKLFLIVNLDLRSDSTLPLNIIPGDLVRLSVEGDKDTRYAPDLHNNLVQVAAISTKVDRVGFVIPDMSKNFILYIGEIEGEKQEISLNFPS